MSEINAIKVDQCQISLSPTGDTSDPSGVAFQDFCDLISVHAKNLRKVRRLTAAQAGLVNRL